MSNIDVVDGWEIHGCPDGNFCVRDDHGVVSASHSTRTEAMMAALQLPKRISSAATPMTSRRTMLPGVNPGPPSNARRQGSPTESIPLRKTILIVDDEPIVRMDIEKVVRECGYEALEAGCAAEALTLLGAGDENIAGVVTDISMPGTRTGLVLAGHVRWMWPHINVVVISGARVPMSGELPPGVRFIPKPVPRSELAQAIGKAGWQ